MSSVHHLQPRTGHAAAAARAGTETVRAAVTALVPEFQQAQLETADGRGLVINLRTPGVDLGQLHAGQWLECVVDTALARVVSARRVA